jgi:phosphate acetyltransferase
MSDRIHAFSSDEPPEIQVHSHERYHAVLKVCDGLPSIVTAVVHPVDKLVIRSVADAVRENLITPVLVGPSARIVHAAEEAEIDISPWQIVDVGYSHAAAEKAAELAAGGAVEAIMKGSLHTDELLFPIVAHNSGLRTGRRLSHSYVMDTAGYHKWLIITDAVVNIAPDLVTKADICRNAIDVWRALSNETFLPKIAVLAAVEVINAKMQATLDAAALCKMAERGQITGCIIDGPLAFDNAISREAAAEKGINSSVAGDPDILLVPDIEAGNILAKHMTFINHADAAGIVMGSKVPVILTSRADTLRTRILSCALAVLVLQARREGRIK